MSAFDNSNFYPIPANYTDSGRLFGGLCEVRNTIEAAVLVVLIGYPELTWLHFALPLKVIVMTITLLPLGVFALIGIGGESLLQYALHMVAYMRTKRVLHFERIQAIEIEKEKGNQRPSHKQKAKKPRKRAKLAGHKSGQERCH
jgi:hypothetical protein